MTVYYTHRYKEMKYSSHDWLEMAISDYIDDREKARELVSRLKRKDSHKYEGKPYIDVFDKFSISHSDKSWAVLIDKRECGLDIQYERDCDFFSISDRFFSSEDANFLKRSYKTGDKTYEEARSDFFEYWTRREAYTKAIGSSVFDDNCPSLTHNSCIEHNGVTYFTFNIEFPGPESLHAAICMDASPGIDENVIYKEMYVE